MNTRSLAEPRTLTQWLPDLFLGLENLATHKLRSLLTMLGMIFGVAAVVAMLSIGAGAQQKVMAFIEQLGVRNIIVEAKEANNYQEFQKIRKNSPGLTLIDYQVIRQNVSDVQSGTPRMRFTPSKFLPKPQQDSPVVYGVEPSYLEIGHLRVTEGRFFDESDNASAAPVCVLGAAAKDSLFGAAPAVGEYVKLNDQWCHVIGIAVDNKGAKLNIRARKAVVVATGGSTGNVNFRRMFDPRLTEEYCGVAGEPWSVQDASGELAGLAVGASLWGLSNFSQEFGDGITKAGKIAELLAQQKRTEQLFNTVMVAIASISLLVGGIGIMNIMLAAILERTREIGVRRAIGARRSDIIRQFVIEAVLISFAGGFLGLVVGFVMSRLIALLAGWSTIVTIRSVLLAFLVSISVGLIFGIYPAVKAARLDPVEAIRYE